MKFMKFAPQNIHKDVRVMVIVIFKIEEYFSDESSLMGYDAFMLITIITDPASCTLRCEYLSRKLRELLKLHLFHYIIFLWFPSGSLVLEEDGMNHTN
jgi:hypothetical protein